MSQRWQAVKWTIVCTNLIVTIRWIIVFFKTFPCRSPSSSMPNSAVVFSHCQAESCRTREIRFETEVLLVLMRDEKVYFYNGPVNKKRQCS